MDIDKKYLAEISRFKSLDPERGWGGDDAPGYTDLYNVGPAMVPGLTAVQSAFAQKIVDLVGQFGQFQAEGIDGAQFEERSDMLDQAICCNNCVFYGGGGDCSIIEQQVNPLGVCRFNTVPERETYDIPSDTGIAL